MPDPDTAPSPLPRIAVVGAGGLGCAILPTLARMDLERLTIIDGDRVEAANLERQPLFETMDIGRLKAGTAALWMRQLLVRGNVVAHEVFLDANNAEELLRDHDIVVEGVDDLHAKTLIDRTCATLGIPLVSGGVHGRQGQVLLLHAPGGNSGLSRASLFPGKAGQEQDGCDMRRVSLSLLEEVARTMAANVYDLLHRRPVVNGRIHLYDQATRAWQQLDPPV